MTQHLKLFVAHLPDDVTEDQLRAVCAPYGDVRYIHLFTDEATGAFTGTARVTLQTENPLEPLLAVLNAHRFGNQRIAVSPAEPGGRWPTLTGDQRKVVQQIAERLDEQAPAALRQLEQVVGLCGETFALGLLEDTLVIEAGEGIWLPKYNRRRTPGGTYLYLAREALAPKMKKAIFPSTRRKKSKSKKPEQPAAPTEPAAPDGAGEAAPTAAEPTGNSEELVVAEPLDQVAETPVQAVAEPAEVGVDDIPSTQEQLAELQRAHQDAQDQLDAVKAGQVSVSPMLAMKAVVDTKRALDDFLRQHPLG